MTLGAALDMSITSLSHRIVHLEIRYPPREITTIIVRGGVPGAAPTAANIEEAQSAARSAGDTFCVVGGLRWWATEHGISARPD